MTSLTMKLAIDANVFVSAANASEPQHAGSLRFLHEVRNRAVAVFCPTLILPECSAAISRPTGSAALAAALVTQIQQWPALQLISLNLALAQRAAAITGAQKLKGADAVYVALTEAHADTWITWDKELLQRGPAIVPTLTPADWLQANVPPPSVP
ncbi:MAG: type II toxin-antitoxin system VapC family toxin [Acidobacteria bacterium]|nr:type II toxin-antitoxin system VapC family toxin [Acidobacteriota bacterium]